MTKSSKLKICNLALLFTTVVILASSIQLEATGSRGLLWVWLHVVVGCGFFANIGWHLYLHFGWKEWLRRLSKQKSRLTRWLSLFALLTILSAIATLIHWISHNYLHSQLGAVHGKLGFIFLILAIVHTVKRFKFYTRHSLK